MKWHYSIWGLRTACGKHLSTSRRLCRDRSLLTCLTCIKAVRS